MSEKLDALVRREILKKFLIKHYKNERLYGRGKEYANTVIDGRIDSLERFGKDCISRHESGTSEAIYYRWAGNELMKEKAPIRIKL